MGVETLGAEFVQGQGKEGHEIDGRKPIQNPDTLEPIKFGIVDSLHGTNGSAKPEVDVVADDKFPKDATDEWPEPKQVHSFYFVRVRSYEDPKLKAKIDQADKEIQRKNQARYQITEALKAKRAERSLVIEKLKPLTSQEKEYRRALGEKKKELEPLQAALGKLRIANNATREKGMGLCSSEEELNERIQGLQYQIQHESNTLVEEKQLVRDIKQLEGTREKVIAHAALQAKLQDSLGQKEAIQGHVKLIGGDLDGVRKEQQAVWAKIKHLEEELKSIDSEISSLQEELAAVSQKRDKAYETLTELRKEREEGNTSFFQYRSLLNAAKDLAAKKDVAALEELSHVETEKFMALWSSSKAVRDEYERRILPSLDSRQLSRDGRMRNPDEKPLVSEASTVMETEVAPAKANIKRTKGDVSTPSEHDPVPTSMVQKEEINQSTETDKKVKGCGMQDTETLSGSELQKEPPATNGIDAAKLKEMKRGEEIAKAKLALERKKKLAEKAAAKAAVRAQKEAEKKQKEREKKARKKAGAFEPSVAEAEQNEADPKNDEAENVEGKIETPVQASKGKETKDYFRYRNRSKAQTPPPNVILKKKQSQSYWVWAAPAAVLVVVVLAGLGYYLLLKN